MPIFVSSDAWIGTEWLDTGLSMWQNEFEYARDYFLPLPNGDLSGHIGKRARYTDAVGFSRSLLGFLVDNEGAKLLEPESIFFFWSEHSDRAGLDSWLAAMSVGADLRRFIGRWALKGSEDGYVRSASRVVENCQRLASMHARASAKGGPDYFGEEETLAQLRNCLEAQGVEEERISGQIQRLTRAMACLPPDPFGSVAAGVFVFSRFLVEL